jgi:hypothetical protein
VPATLVCFAGNDARAACDRGRVRLVVLRPRDPLKRGVDYVAIVNPVDERPIVDGVGSPTPLTKESFSF